MSDPRRARWTGVLRAGLAAMWLVHGLEKFGVRWPSFLHGGTHSVAGMLETMLDFSPFPWLRAVVSGGMLPLADWLQYPVGVLEILLGLALATGLGMTWAAVVGAGMQIFFWLGFFANDWPFQYPVVILAHLTLAAPSILRRVETGDGWLFLVRLALGGLWVYEGAVRNPWLLVLGLPLLLGVGSRFVSLVAVYLVARAWQVELWGDWPWSYSLVAICHLVLIWGGSDRGPALAARLPERLRQLGA